MAASNQPLIGGRLELEGAAAFIRTAKQLERTMSKLNDTMQISAAEGVSRRLTKIAVSFDAIGKSSAHAARGLRAVDLQVQALGRRTRTIDRLSESIARLNIAGSIAGPTVGATRGVVSNAALLSAITAQSRVRAVPPPRPVPVPVARAVPVRVVALPPPRIIRTSGGGGIRRGFGTALGAFGGGGFGGGGGRGGASRPQDLIPGVGLGSTAYFRGNVGPAAIYTRMPLTLTSIGAAAGIASAAVLSLGASFAKTATSAKVFGGLNTDVELDRLTKSAIELSRNFSNSADSVVKGATVLGKAGAPISGLNNELVRTTALFARASEGELETEEAAKILVQTIKAQNLAWSEASAVADAYTGVVQNSSLQFQDLDNVLTQVLPIATELGYTYKDVAVATALLTDRGLSASVATTALKNTFLRLGDPSKEALKILKDYNIALFDTNGKALPLPEVLGRITSAFSKNGQQGAADAQEFFDMADIGTTRTILAFSNLSRAGVDAFEELSRKANVSTEEIAAALDRNLIKQLEIVGNQATAAALTISSRLDKTFLNLATGANESLRAINEDGFVQLGNSINRVITLQDEFSAALFRAVNPGVVALFNSLVGTVDDLSGAADAAKTAIINMATGISSGVILGVVVFDLLKRSILGVDQQSNQFSQNETKRQEKIRREALETAIFIASIPIAVGRYVGQRFHNREPNTKGGADLLGVSIGGYTPEYEFPVDDFATIMKSVQNEWAKTLGIVDSGAKSVVGSVEDTTVSTANSLIQLFGTVANEYNALMAQLNAGAAKAQADFTRTAVFGAMTNEGFWKDGMPPITLTKPAVAAARVPFISSGGSTFPSAGGGGSSEPSLEDITKQVKSLLSDMPGLKDELFSFIAGLAQDVPARLMPMVSAIKASRNEVGQLLVAKSGLLAIDLQLLQSSKRMAALQAQESMLDIQQSIATIGYDKQLLGLRQQALEIDQQMAPIRDRLLIIDREISRLQQENLGLARQRLEIELEMLPLQTQLAELDKAIEETQRRDFGNEKARLQLTLDSLQLRRDIEDIDSKIAEVGKKNFDLARRQLEADMEALPLRRQLRSIEEAINSTIDKRAGIYSRLKQLDLADIEDELAGAWEKMDVPEIIRLEEKKKATEESLKVDEKAERKRERAGLGLELEKIRLEELLAPMERRQQTIADTLEDQEFLNQITLLSLEEQREALLALLKPFDDKLLKLTREQELRDLLNEVTRLGLEEEKQKIIDQLLPLQNKIDAINAEIATENLRNQITITHLEEEKRKLEEQLIPLEDNRRAVERIIAEVDLLRARTALQFEEHKIGIKELILREQLRQAELEETRREQEALFLELVEGFVASLTESRAFTREEAVEVSKRSGLWDKSVEDIMEITTELGRVRDAADSYREALERIPKDIVITITTKHRTEGGPGGPVANGVDPGPEATGGSDPANSVAGFRAASATGSSTVINNNSSYNVAANYSKVRSPATIAQDMRALIMASRN